jgi:hypothetical protein
MTTTTTADHSWFYKRTYPSDGILEPSVDATYILHVLGNNRYKQFAYELQHVHPTKTVYVMFTKSYKSCIKYAHGKQIDNIQDDINDSFIHIFKHASQQNYQNILVLEDDFQFHRDITTQHHTDHINRCIVHFQNHQYNQFLYFLGCIPFLQTAYDRYTCRMFTFGLSHAVIYSRLAFSSIIEEYQETPIKYPFDIYLSYKFPFCSYTYYRPLCYQTFPKTENSETWLFTSKTLLRRLIKLLRLDETPEPGFTVLYLCSRVYSKWVLSSIYDRLFLVCCSQLGLYSVWIVPIYGQTICIGITIAAMIFVVVFVSWLTLFELWGSLITPYTPK